MGDAVGVGVGTGVSVGVGVGVSVGVGVGVSVGVGVGVSVGIGVSVGVGVGVSVGVGVGAGGVPDARVNDIPHDGFIELLLLIVTNPYAEHETGASSVTTKSNEEVPPGSTNKVGSVNGAMLQLTKLDVIMGDCKYKPTEPLFLT